MPGGPLAVDDQRERLPNIVGVSIAEHHGVALETHRVGCDCGAVPEAAVHIQHAVDDFSAVGKESRGQAHFCNLIDESWRRRLIHRLYSGS